MLEANKNNKIKEEAGVPPVMVLPVVVLLLLLVVVVLVVVGSQGRRDACATVTVPTHYQNGVAVTDKGRGKGLKVGVGIGVGLVGCYGFPADCHSDSAGFRLGSLLDCWLVGWLIGWLLGLLLACLLACLFACLLACLLASMVNVLQHHSPRFATREVEYQHLSLHS
ncbi:hypothetical protein M0802_002533 [Mischocyttarus mexicanus]|nr:hypothetical protein M0802_002533 [Mischocyttarus mexicanus]